MAAQLVSLLLVLAQPAAAAPGIEASASVYPAEQYGALCDGATDVTAALQRAIDAAEQAHGGMVLLPSGFCLVTAPLVIRSGVIISGVGTGVGAGYGNSGGTVVRAMTPEQNVFEIRASEAVTLRDLTIDAPHVLKTGGAGILIASSGGGHNSRTRIENMNIVDMYDGVRVMSGMNWVIDRTHIQDYQNVGVYLSNEGPPDGRGSAVDAGQNSIANSVIWDLNVGTSQACIRYDMGGDLRVTNNKLLGSDYGFRLALMGGPTGTVILSNNSIEQQRTIGILAQQIESGMTFDNLVITGNQLSIIFPIVGLPEPPSPQSSINIIRGDSGAWLGNVVITSNAINNAFPTSHPVINVQDGRGIVVSNNVIDTNGHGAAKDVAVAGNASEYSVQGNVWVQ